MMEAPDAWLYEYAVLRYVPRVDRGEFINIGLIMMNKRRKWMKGLVRLDEARIKALFPATDINCLRNQCRLFERNDVPEKDLPVEEKYRWMTAVKSAVLQVSPSHPGMVPVRNKENMASKNAEEIMEEEFSRLFSRLVK